MSKKSDQEFAEMTSQMATHGHVLGDGTPQMELTGHYDDTPVLRDLVNGKIFDASNPDHVDAKGRILPEYLSAEEKLNELVTTFRTVNDALESFVSGAAKNPMFKMLGLGK